MKLDVSAGLSAALEEENCGRDGDLPWGYIVNRVADALSPRTISQRSGTWLNHNDSTMKRRPLRAP